MIPGKGVHNYKGVGVRFADFISFILSLSHTEHGCALGSNTLYSVIHGLTGTSIELNFI